MSSSTCVSPLLAIGSSSHLVNTSYDALVQVFERISNFLKRLEIYSRIRLTPPMTDIIVQTMMKILPVLALATKEIKQGLFSKQIYPICISFMDISVEKFVKKRYVKRARLKICYRD
jgi:hypothetical protein